MPDYVSPYVAAAAHRAALQMPVLVPRIDRCPSCGTHPAINPEFFNEVCIYCDNDECDELGEAQGMGPTLRDASAKWNEWAAEYMAGAGGLK